MLVSLTAYNRPQYLKLVLDSLRLAGTYASEPFTLVVRVDPSDDTNEIVSLLSVPDLACLYTVNDRRLGLQANTYAALEDAWDFAPKLNQDFVLHAESDRFISPDAIKLSCWMRDQYRSDPSVIFTSLRGVKAFTPPHLANAVRRWDWFSTGWFGMWLSTWNDHLKPIWDHSPYDSFDWNIARRLMGWERRVDGYRRTQDPPPFYQVTPFLSRSMHLWHHGIHAPHFVSGVGDPEEENIPFADYSTLLQGDYFESPS